MRTMEEAEKAVELFNGYVSCLLTTILTSEIEVSLCMHLDDVYCLVFSSTLIA